MIVDSVIQDSDSKNSVNMAFYLDCGEQVGEVTLDVEGDELWIWSLGIFEQFRGNGYSKILMSDIEEFARNRSLRTLKLIVLDINKKARKLYLKCGFRTCERDIIHRYMKKDLK